MNISDAIEGFLLDRRQARCSEDTLRWYKQKLRRWQRDMQQMGVESIEQITIGHLRQFLVDVQETVADAENPRKPTNGEGKKVSSLTVHGYAQVIKTFCKWLYMEELLDKNPATRLEMPKVGKYVIKTFTVEHLEAMLSECDTSTPLGFRNYVMIALMADTGIRLGEIIRLTVDNFCQVNAQGKSHIKVLGKGQKEREVGVSPEVAKLLWKYIKVYRQSRTPDEQRLFLGRNGKPLGKRGVEAIVERIRDAAGIANVRCSPHTFRHSFAVAYLEQGGDIYKLSKEVTV